MAEAMTVSPRSSPHSPKLFLEVRMMMTSSQRAETRVKKAAGPAGHRLYSSTLREDTLARSTCFDLQ